MASWSTSFSTSRAVIPPSHFEPLTLYGGENQFIFSMLFTMPDEPRDLFNLFDTRLQFTVDQNAVVQSSVTFKKRFEMRLGYSFTSHTVLKEGLLQRLQIDLPKMPIDELRGAYFRHSKGSVSLFDLLRV